MVKSFLVSIACMAAVACTQPTSFHGEAKFPDGAEGCRRTCAADGMEMGGFVYSGEYSTSCVCTPHAGAPGTAGAATTMPTAGVIVQAQAAAAAAANQQLMMQQQQQQQRSMQR